MALQNDKNAISDERVTGLLAGLPRVEAPGDFEAKVRSGIARRRSHTRNTNWIASLRYAVPVLLFALFSVAGLTVYLSRSTQNVTPEVAPAAASVVPEISVPASSPDQITPVIASKPSSIPPTTVAAARPTRRSAAVPIRRVQADAPSGFKDVTVREAKPTIFVRDVDPTTGSQGANRKDDVQTPTPLNVPALLRMMGVDGEKVENGWKVRSAAAGGTAERSGVRAGDVIESIDDKPLNSAAPVTQVTFGSLQVLRDGQRVRVQIKNK